MKQVQVVATVLWLLQVFCPVAMCDMERLTHEKRIRGADVYSQPVHNTKAWEWVAPINGSGYCGPAALFQIIAYYGDFGSFEQKDRSGKRWLDRPLRIRPIRGTSSRFVDDSDFAKYIQPYSTGSSWTLLKKVANLYRSKNDDVPLYHVCLCSTATPHDNVAARRSRLDDIRGHYLDQGIPVIIHLDGVSLLPGHYLTLIGDDPKRSFVFFVDSLNPSAGIQSVSRESFVSDWFYGSGKHYKARWDGTWMAFWHSGKVRACRECGDSR